MSDSLKNIVVIGVGFGGRETSQLLAKSLPPTHRVLALSESDFSYYPPGALRASTVPGWEHNVVVPLDRMFSADSRHKVIVGKVVELRKDSVKLDRAVYGFGDVISFDYVVVATGSRYDFPSRAPLGATLDQVKANLRTFQSEIKESSSILVVGGGSTGIEFAGEVAAQYPGQKKVTLVNREPELLAHGLNSRVGGSLKRQLIALGVDLQLGASVVSSQFRSGKVPLQTFTLSNGEKVQADYVFVAFGCTPNSSLVRSLTPLAVNPGGFVKVNSLLQVTDGSEAFPKMFALGDVTDIPETKLAFSANNHGAVVAANILSLVNNQQPSKVYTAARPIAMVTCGPSGGAGQVFGIVLGAWFATRLKSGALGIERWKKPFGYSVTEA